MDELNHDFQALALEGRTMGEVRVQERFAGYVCIDNILGRMRIKMV